MLTYLVYKKIGSGGIRTHASEETGALNQRLRPLGHATYYLKILVYAYDFISFSSKPPMRI